MALIFQKVLLLLFSLALTTHLGLSYSQTCLRQPRKVHMPKTPGDGNFEIEISGNPDKYMPGDMYTIKLKSKITENSKPKFKEFMLAVESTNEIDRYMRRSVGTFQLSHSFTSIHSKDCPNAVIQASHILKSEIEVLWGAPPAGSGCLKFKAMVVEPHDVWYKDDGELTKEFCEERQDSDTMQPETIKTCCTCDEAKYEVTFDGMWSRQTHPKDYPTNQWLTHFSDIIGASHSNNYNMWRYGGLASPGLTQVAEWGSTRTLESELKKESKNIRTIIKARGLWHPNVNSKTFAVFRVDRKHHLMSLVSMLGPSPDWFVGVSDLELCLPNCTWIDHKTINLFPWDAGTDSGISYSAANQDTVPREKIKRISNSEPNNPKSPFFDPKPKKPMKPLAKLTITRQRVYEKKCKDVFGNGLLLNSDDYEDPADELRPECALHEWSHFPPCPVTCGNGIVKRYRTYLNPSKAVQFQCKRLTEQGEMCEAPTPCPNGGYQENPNCHVSEWERWSPCSASCGQGVQTRSRHYISRYGLKQCFENLYDERLCKTDIPCRNNGREVDPSCSTTKWGRWSMCSASCGQGIMKRYRYFFQFNATERECGAKTEESRKCQGIKADCSISREEAIGICQKPQDPGPCRAYFTRYYFDPVKKSCRQFVWGGCKGNENNFEHLEGCNQACAFSEDHRSKYDENSAYFGGLTPESQLRLPVNCVVSQWSEMSQCSVTCGRGWKEQRRTVQVEPQFGGKSCPKKMVKRRKCKLTRCNKWNKHNLKSSSHKLDFNPYSRDLYGSNRLSSPLERSNQEKLLKEIEGGAFNTNQVCEMGNWSPWSPCTHSCGPEALQQRDRSIVVKARGSGRPCGPTLERRYCTLPPCPRRG